MQLCCTSPSSVRNSWAQSLWSRSVLAGALVLGTLAPTQAFAQEKPIAGGLNNTPAQVVLEGDDVPNYLVTAHTYEFLLSALLAGHGTWSAHVLEPLGIEHDSRAEAELETFLLEARNTIQSSLHVHYDSEQEPDRFQRDQLNFRFEKMGEMALVHSQLVQILNGSGVGAQGLLDFMETQIRPTVKVSIYDSIAKSAAINRAREEAIFGYYDQALSAAKAGDALPKASPSLQKSGSSGDVISLSGWAMYPNCGEGLLGRRGWHNLKLVVKDKATVLSLNGQLQECEPVISFIGTACAKAAAATGSGQSITCYSTAGDEPCRFMFRHRGWQKGTVYRTGMGPIVNTNTSACHKPDRCDDWNTDPPRP